MTLRNNVLRPIVKKMKHFVSQLSDPVYPPGRHRPETRHDAEVTFARFRWYGF